MKDLSFLVEVNQNNNSFTNIVKPLLRVYKLSALKRDDFKNQPKILKKYFRNNNRDLDRFHIPEISAEEYRALVGNPKNPLNAELRTATDYYIRKIRIQSVANDLGVNPKSIDTKDYIWDERYYITYDFLNNVNIVDDWFRDHGEDRHKITSRQLMITEDPHKAVLDEDMFNDLYSFCIEAIKKRKVMLLCKVDKCLSFLHNVIEYTYGFTINPTAQMVATMKNYMKFFTDLCKNKEFAEYIKTTNDIDVYGSDSLTHSDYINTYKSTLRGLIKGSDKDLNDIRDLLTCTEDPYIDEILDCSGPEVKLSSESYEYSNSHEE